MVKTLRFFDKAFATQILITKRRICLTMHVTACLFVFASCHEVAREDMLGLWELNHVSVDGLNKNYSPTFLDFDRDYSFAVSKKSGDIIGLYGIKNSRVKLESEDNQWFNTSWKLKYFKDTLVMEGIEIPYTVTRLTWSRADGLPSFQEFEGKVLGKWRLYKMMTKTGIVKMDSAYFDMDNNGHYAIYNQKAVLEKGSFEIDARHHKIIFKKHEMSWDIWFYGNELRLKNEAFDIQYCLRKD